MGQGTISDTETDFLVRNHFQKIKKRLIPDSETRSAEHQPMLSSIKRDGYGRAAQRRIKKGKNYHTIFNIIHSQQQNRHQKHFTINIKKNNKF